MNTDSIYLVIIVAVIMAILTALFWASVIGLVIWVGSCAVGVQVPFLPACLVF